MSTSYSIRARRASDFAIIEEDQQTKEMAIKSATHHFVNGYDVTVTLVVREVLATWEHKRNE